MTINSSSFGSIGGLPGGSLTDLEYTVMEVINRSAVIVIPAEPFLKWLHGADSTSAELALADLRREPTIYLLPPYDTEEEALSHLEDVCGEIFEEQLDGWYRVPSSWPINRDFDLFKRSFEYRFHSILVDLSEDPLERGEL